LVAGCLAVTAIAYWQYLSDATNPGPPAPLQLKIAAPPVASRDVAPAALSKDVAVVAPVKDTASAPTTKAPTTNAPARVTPEDRLAANTVEPRKDAPPPSAPDVSVSTSPVRAMTYERRVADATTGAAEDADRAFRELQDLAAAEPNRPEAYEAMARISLRKRDYVQARELIGSALDHGGKASFMLIHDHSRGNFEADDPKATCIGELRILADGVRFEAINDGDRFSANWAEIREAGSNRFFGSGIGGFHVAVTAAGKYKNFNLAPESKDKAEGKLILDLLAAYTRKSDRTR
jgi:hypothetical protein